MARHVLVDIVDTPPSLDAPSLVTQLQIFDSMTVQHFIDSQSSLLGLQTNFPLRTTNPVDFTYEFFTLAQLRLALFP